jgi:DNA-binding response OmpR family regulator
MPRVLVIDDDVELCDLVREYLHGEGFEVSACHDGETGLETATRGDHVLVVLDVMLPRLNGFDVLRQLRGRSSVPVLMLTARGDDVDRIVGLEIGADDYLPKPFNPRELVARIRAILRRTAERTPSRNSPARPSNAPRLQLDELVLDPGMREARRGEAQLDLTSVEFDILHLLMKSAGQVVGRDSLSRAALGRPFRALDRSLDMHVCNLRRKLGTGAKPAIKTVRSAGYLLARESSATGDLTP